MKPVAKKAAPKAAKKTTAKPVAKKAAPKAPKKAVAKPVAKKTAAKPQPKAKAPAKKAVAVKTPLKPVVKKEVPKAPVKKEAPKAPVKKEVAKKPEAKKPEVKKPEVKKPEVKKVEVKKPEAAKKVAPVEKTPIKKAEKQPEVKKPEVKKPEPVKVVAPEVQPVATKKTAAKKSTKKNAPPPPPAPTYDNPEIKLGPVKILPPKRELNPQPVKVTSTVLDNRTRYSDEELQEFKELITGKLEAARNELKYLQEQISRSSEMGDDSDARFKGLEDGTSTSEREYLSQMASRQITYIGHLEKALIRIENKTYGICRETGKLISKERLRAVPHATLSIEAKQGKG
ncbi:MAG TPA: TraR/DksA C4-type zinc finger protein [Chitinophagales bacterium]|nr:TraR/DksA C4-type zinc finger protein [Chitinophagales bacterium]